ncbi:MAG: Rne/Rng family ribonuclease [Phycisphaeraceae bacterium]
MPKKEMLINFVPGEECRIAIVENGRLEEFYQERASTESHVGNIYKGRVVNVEPSIQAAFVDFGLERNGFLHISDLHPKYFHGEHKEDTEMVGQKTPRHERPPIQKSLRRGQEILVQVLKEGIGTKGPTLTSYLSIPGRYLVMMPDMERLGVSRKIEDDEARREMRRMLDDLNPPKDFGFIIRTAGIGRTKTDLKRDLAYLIRLWKSIDTRMRQLRGVGELYTESDLLIRTLRDVFSNDIERIVIDDPVAARRAKDFFTIASPRSGPQVLRYNDSVPLFHRFDIERQIENINARVVPLESGGTLVIDQTEALVAIDVNSGKYRDNRDAEMTAYKINLEACDEICRQLRLRDLGGVIVNDLIDMRSPKHRRDLEQRFRVNLKKDRARTRALAISQFGIVEMTRQRMRPSLHKSTYIDCTACQGAGKVKSSETVVLDVMRRLALVMPRKDVARIELTVSPDVAFQLLNRKRSSLVELEKQYDKPVMVRVNGGGPVDFIDLACFDGRGGAVQGEALGNLEEPTLETLESTGLLPDDDYEESEELEEGEEEADGEVGEPDDDEPAPQGLKGRDIALPVHNPNTAEIVVDGQILAVEQVGARPTPESEGKAYADVDQETEGTDTDSAGERHEPAHAGEGDGAGGGEAVGGTGRRRRRRRRRRGRGGGSAVEGGETPAGAIQPSGDHEAAPEPIEPAAVQSHGAVERLPTAPPGKLPPQPAVHSDGSSAGAPQGEGGGRRRRRRRRGGRGRGGGTAGGAAGSTGGSGSTAGSGGMPAGGGDANGSLQLPNQSSRPPIVPPRSSGDHGPSGAGNRNAGASGNAGSSGGMGGAGGSGRSAGSGSSGAPPASATPKPAAQPSRGYTNRVIGTDQQDKG